MSICIKIYLRLIIAIVSISISSQLFSNTPSNHKALPSSNNFRCTEDSDAPGTCPTVDQMFNDFNSLGFGERSTKVFDWPTTFLYLKMCSKLAKEVDMATLINGPESNLKFITYVIDTSFGVGASRTAINKNQGIQKSIESGNSTSVENPEIRKLALFLDNSRYENAAKDEHDQSTYFVSYNLKLFSLFTTKYYTHSLATDTADFFYLVFYLYLYGWETTGHASGKSYFSARDADTYVNSLSNANYEDDLNLLLSNIKNRLPISKTAATATYRSFYLGSTVQAMTKLLLKLTSSDGNSKPAFTKNFFMQIPFALMASVIALGSLTNDIWTKLNEDQGPYSTPLEALKNDKRFIAYTLLRYLKCYGQNNLTIITLLLKLGVHREIIESLTKVDIEALDNVEQRLLVNILAQSLALN